MAKLLISASLKGNIIQYHIMGVGSDFRGKTATITVYLFVMVKHQAAVHRKKILFTENIYLDSSDIVGEIELDHTDFYSYEGENIDIGIEVEVKIDGFMFFDTIGSTTLSKELFSKAEVVGVGKSIVIPKDSYDLIENFKAIDAKSKLKIFIAGGALLIMMVISSILLYIEMQLPTAFQGDDGSFLDTMIKFTIALSASLLVYIKFCMRQYMTLFFKNVIGLGKYGRVFKLSEILEGKSRIDLHNISIRVLAYNIERGQYTEKRGYGKDRKTVTLTFNHKVEAIILCEEHIDFIAKKSDIGQYLQSSFSFDELYNKLHPPLTVGDNHGLDIGREVQIMSEKFMDKRCIGKRELFNYQDFLRSEG